MRIFEAMQGFKYAQAGAAAISVLTEPTWFKGFLTDMRDVRKRVADMTDRPAVLRKVGYDPLTRMVTVHRPTRMFSNGSVFDAVLNTMLPDGTDAQMHAYVFTDGSACFQMVLYLVLYLTPCSRMVLSRGRSSETQQHYTFIFGRVFVRSPIFLTVILVGFIRTF